MGIKFCEYCGKEIITNCEIKRFCNPICQRKHYNQRLEIKEKSRLRTREYRKSHPELKERHNFLELTRHRERRAKYWKEYGKRPEVRKRIREKEKLRRQSDKRFLIEDRLRRSLNHALTKYTEEGKIMSSREYGINWKEIIESLKPFPKNLEEFEIDHIIPLHAFNLENPREVKLAFSPKNLQWLTAEKNRKKSNKISEENKNLLRELEVMAK